MTTDLQSRVTDTRERIRAVEAEARSAATVLADLEAAHDAVERGVDPTGEDESVDDLTDRVRGAFTDLQTAVFGWFVSELEVAFDAYDPAAFGTLLDDLRVPFADLDAATVEAKLDAAEDACWRTTLIDSGEETAPILKAYNAGDRQAYENALDDLERFYDAIHTESIEQYTTEFSNLFHTTYESAAKSHVQQLKQAFAATDKTAFETQVEQLETAFETHHATAVDDRIASLRDGLRNGDVSAVEDQVADLDGSVSATQPYLETLTYRLNDDIARLVEQYPGQLDSPLSTLADPLQPVLMLPVDLETRFSEPDADDRCRLRIRVYPDDAHVNTHERGLTRPERDAGREFWERVWWATHDVPTSGLTAELDARDEADRLDDVDLASLPEAATDRLDAVVARAWASLTNRFDARRAAWVKRATAPPQGDDLLDSPVAPADLNALDFGTLGDDVPTLPGAWTRPPRARLLPDRWVAIVDLGDQTRTVEGRAIREPLSVGPAPDPTGRDDPANTQADPDWLTDFEAAKKVGMGLETELDLAAARDGVESILVVGVKSSMTADESASALRDLLDAHHYADGLAMLDQGTPTNNTDGAAAGATGSGLADADVACGPSLASPGTDGAKAARLLGLDPDQLGQSDAEHVFAHVPGADGLEQRDARNFNQALWSATWGYYVRHMLAPADAVNSSEDADYEALETWLGAYRDHFAEYVRARGPLPALRVGDQPYGVLPATTLDDAHWESLSLAGADGAGDGNGGGSAGSFEAESFPDRDVLDDLVDAVRALRSVWSRSADDVTVLENVGEAADGTGAVADLLDLLSLDATSVGYRTRAQYGSEVMFEPAGDDADLHRKVQAALNAVTYAGGLGHVEDAFDPSETPPKPRIAETLLWGEESDPVEPLVADDLEEFLDGLLDSPFASLTPAEPGDAIVEGGAQGPLKDARDWFAVMGNDPDSLLQALLYYATLQEYATARARLGHLYDDGPTNLDQLQSGDVWHLFPEPELYYYEDAGIVTRLNDPVTDSLAAHPELTSEHSYAEALDRARDLDAGAPISPQLETHTESLEYVQNRKFDPDEAERLLTETLDLASHRLDAWITSVATRRLDDVRAHQATATGADPGVYVGGWGYVTDVRKTDDPASDGYLHAPSIQQATTGAVLRNGSLAFEGERADLLDLDLSPERVGAAMEVIATVRAGQDLGTQLGYRFERRLRESEIAPDADEYVPGFRALCPPVAGKQERPDDSGTPSEAASRDLVDGLALYRLWRDEKIPWGQTVEGSPTGRSLPDDGDDDAAYNAIDIVLSDFEETLGAVKDLLTAESVHQLLQGKSMRSGASLDALARGEAPPEIEVVDTPRTGTGVTHRMLVLFGDSAPESPADWPTSDRQARADAEPALDAWVADVLPDPATVACACTIEEFDDDGEVVSADDYGVTLADLGLSPLDLLAVAEGGPEAQRSELEQRVLYHLDREYGIPEDGDVELIFKPVAEWLHAAEDLQGLSSLDGLTSFGEVLAAVEPLGDLVSTGRPADARDLRTPASAGEPNWDAVTLRTRANLAVNRLDGVDADLTTLLPAVESDDEGRTQLDDLDAVADAVGDLPSGTDLSTLVSDLDAIDASAVREDAATLRAALDAGVLSLATVEGEIRVEPASDATVEGVVAAPQGTTLEVEIVVGGANRFMGSREVTVGQDGEFDATFDLSGQSAGDTVGVVVSAPGGEVDSALGEVVATVSGTPTTDPNVGPVSVPALAAFTTGVAALSQVGSAVADFPAALDRADGELLSTVNGAVDWQAARNAPDWNATWPADAEGVVADLLDLPPIALPGFGHDDLDGTTWHDATFVAENFDPETPLVAHPHRAMLRDALDALEDHADDALERAVTDGLTSAAATCRDLAGVAEAQAAAAGFRVAVAESLRDALMRAAHFGVGAAVPQSATGYGDDAIDILSRQAAAVATEVVDRLADAPSASDGSDPDAEVERERIEAVFGESFTVLPPFAPTNAADLDSALSVSNSESLQNGNPMAAETWFRRSGRVRDAPETLGRAFASAEAITGPGVTFDAGQSGPRFRVSQLPYREDDDWVGLPDAWDDEDPAGRLSLVTHTATAHEGQPAAGLFVDEWVETVPSNEESTGVAFQHDRPTNQPPQSMLLAAPPNRDGWSVERLSDVVAETMDLARARTVEPSTLEDLGHFLPAVTYATNSYDGPDDPPTVSLDLTDLTGGN